MKQNRISRSARGKNCTARIPGVCSHDPETTVLGHAPFAGKFGSRNQWWWSAYVCNNCHDVLDDRDRHLTREEKNLVWYAAVHETQENLIEQQLMKVLL